MSEKADARETDHKNTEQTRCEEAYARWLGHLSNRVDETMVIFEERARRWVGAIILSEPSRR